MLELKSPEPAAPGPAVSEEAAQHKPAHTSVLGKVATYTWGASGGTGLFVVGLTHAHTGGWVWSIAAVVVVGVAPVIQIGLSKWWTYKLELKKLEIGGRRTALYSELAHMPPEECEIKADALAVLMSVEKNGAQLTQRPHSTGRRPRTNRTVAS
jgi:hypothetical protein